MFYKSNIMAKIYTFLLLFASASAVIHGKYCSKEWIPYGGSCYYFSKSPMSWYDARVQCRKMGGWLATAETTMENEWLRLQLILSNKDHTEDNHLIALGGIDELKENDWKWEGTAQSIRVSGWGKNEPDGSTVENCLAAHSGNKYLWADVSCERVLHGFVCEK